MDKLGRVICQSFNENSDFVSDNKVFILVIKFKAFHSSLFDIYNKNAVKLLKVLQHIIDYTSIYH